MIVKRLPMLAAVVMAAAGAVAGPASAASIGGFGARPAHFDPAVPATRAYFIRRVSPGGTLSDAVLAFNAGAAPLHLRVYPVDGLTGATSGVVYGNRDAGLGGAGRWVTLPVSEVIVPPHGRVSVPFTVNVPTDARAGVHLAGLALEDADSHTSTGRFHVTEVVRTVVGIELNLPGPATTQIAVRGLSVAGGSASTAAGFVVGIDNTGTQLCKPTLSLTINGPSGAQRVTRRLDTVLPGSSIPYPVTWPRPLQRGRYAAEVSASGCGRTSVLRTGTTVGRWMPSARTPTGVTVNAPAARPSGSSLPGWWLIVLVGAGGVGVGAFLSRGRRRLRYN